MGCTSAKQRQESIFSPIQVPKIKQKDQDNLKDSKFELFPGEVYSEQVEVSCHNCEKMKQLQDEEQNKGDQGITDLEILRQMELAALSESISSQQNNFTPNLQRITECQLSQESSQLQNQLYYKTSMPINHIKSDDQCIKMDQQPIIRQFNDCFPQNNESELNQFSQNIKFNNDKQIGSQKLQQTHSQQIQQILQDFGKHENIKEADQYMESTFRFQSEIEDPEFIDNLSPEKTASHFKDEGKRFFGSDSLVDEYIESEKHQQKISFQKLKPIKQKIEHGLSAIEIEDIIKIPK